MSFEKTNFLKEIRKSFDLFVAIVLGVIGSVLFFYFDKINIVGTLKLSDKWFGFARNFVVFGALTVFICLIVAFLVNAFRKKVTIYDFLLITFEAFSVTSIVLEAIKGAALSGTKLAFWIVLTVLGLGLFALRYVFVKEVEDEPFGGKKYFATLAYRYNFLVLGVIGLALGIGIGAYLESTGVNNAIAAVFPAWNEMGRNSFKYGLIAGVVGGILLLINFVTILNNKKSKVSLFDACLVVLQIATVSSAAYFVPNLPDFNISVLLMYVVVNIGILATIIIRALFIDSSVELTNNKPCAKVYYHQIASESSLTLLTVVGLVFGGLIVYFDYIGFARLFTFRWSHWIPLFVIICVLIVALITLTVIALVKKQLKATKIVLIDKLLYVAAVTISVTSLMFLLDYFTATKLIVWLVADLVFAYFLVKRIRSVLPVVTVSEEEIISEELENEEVSIENEEIEEEVSIENEESEEVQSKESPIVEENLTNIVAVEEPDVDEEVVEEDEEDGFASVRYKKSYLAKLTLASEQVKDYYNALKNYLLCFKLSNRTSWNYETFNKGRRKVAKVNVRGKTLVVYLSLDPQAYEGTKYHFRDASGSKKYASTPMMIKIRSGRGLKYAFELIDVIMSEVGAKKRNLPVADYIPEVKDFDQLVSEGLIKDLNPSVE